MDDDATASQSDLQMEDAGNDKSKGSYKSWKKKYRKMRDTFDRKMRDGEELYRKEQKAIDTNKRIAIEIDRLLDMLLDLNNAPQIPTDKRFDLSLKTRPKDMPDELVLPIDVARPTEPGDDDLPRPEKSFAELLERVPHHKYAAAARLFPEVAADLEAGTEGFPGAIADSSQASHPPSFLTADDIDNYLWEADRRVAQRRRDLDAPALPQIPTLAPKALAALQDANANNSTPTNGVTNGRKSERSGSERSRAAAAAAADDEATSAANRDFALRNPTSVYNWLRKHAPKTFLQDGEASADKENGDDDDHHNHNGSHKSRLPSGHDKAASGSSTRSRKSVGAAAERRASAAAAKGTTTPTANRRSAAGGARGAKRSAAAARSSLSASMIAASDLDDGASVATHEDDDETMSLDAAVAATPTAGKGGAIKRKRPAEDDSGYRPKGGTSRPAKKSKRKSEGGDGDVTPTATGRGTKARRSHLSTAEAVDEPGTDEIE